MEMHRTTKQRISGWVGVAVIGIAVVLGGAPVGLETNEAHARSSDHESYDSAETYQGVFVPAQLYRIVQGTDWWAGSRRPARMEDLACRDARRALEAKGQWHGAMNSRGGCESGEPTDWATGNFLNFQAARYYED